jgi:carbon monoxide dehydrogenase subunit G
LVFPFEEIAGKADFNVDVIVEMVANRLGVCEYRLGSNLKGKLQTLGSPIIRRDHKGLA